MKKVRILSRIAAVSVTACLLFSNQPWTFAAAAVNKDVQNSKEYLSEIKMFYGRTESDARGYCTSEGYIFCPENLNKGANTDIGAYLGYKTTRDPDDALTDITLLDMKKSHYDVMDYKTYLDLHAEEFSDEAHKMMVLVNNFRNQYRAGSPTALAAYDSLNLIYIDESKPKDQTSNLFGNYILNEATDAFFQKFIQRGNSNILNTIISILCSASADYNSEAPDETETWVDRAKKSEIPEQYAKANSADRNLYDASYRDSARKLIKEMISFSEVYSEAKELYDTYGDTFGYEGLDPDDSLEELREADPNCRIPEYSNAIYTYEMLDSCAFHQKGESIVTNAAVLSTSDGSDTAPDDADSSDDAYAADRSVAEYFLELAEDDDLSDHPERVYDIIQGFTPAQLITLEKCGLRKLAEGLHQIGDYSSDRRERINNAVQELKNTGYESGSIYLWSGVDTSLYSSKVAETSKSTEIKNAGLAYYDSKTAAEREEENKLLNALPYIEIGTLIYMGIYSIVMAIAGISSLFSVGVSLFSAVNFGMVAGLAAVGYALAGVMLCTLYILNIACILVSLAMLVYTILDLCGVFDEKPDIDFSTIPYIVFHMREGSNRSYCRVRYDSVRSNDFKAVDDSDDTENMDPDHAEMNAYQGIKDRWIAMYSSRSPDLGKPIEVPAGKSCFVVGSTYKAPEGYRALTLVNTITAANINDVEINEETGSPLYVFFPGESGIMSSGTIVESDSYITGVRLSCEESREDAVNSLIKEGFEYIDLNLTPGQKYTYIGYRFGAKEQSYTDLRISTTNLPQMVFGEASYANLGTTSDGLSLYATASPAAGTPITKISVETERLPLGSGAEPACLFSGGNAVDLKWKRSDNHANFKKSYFMDHYYGFKLDPKDTVKEEDPINGHYLYFWPKVQFTAESDDSEPPYVAGFSYFIAPKDNINDNRFGSGFRYMQTFAEENGFELLSDDEGLFKAAAGNASKMTWVTTWRDAEGGKVDTYHYDAVHTVAEGTSLTEGDGGLIHSVGFSSQWALTGFEKMTMRDEKTYVLDSEIYFGISCTYNPYRAITGVSALLAPYTETTHSIRYTGLTTPAGTMLASNVSVQGYPIHNAGISYGYQNHNMNFPLYLNDTAEQVSDLDWMTKEKTEIQERYLLTSGPKSSLVPIRRDEIRFVTHKDPGSIDGFVPVCDMRTPGDYGHPFNLALETANYGSKYLYLYLKTNAGGRSVTPEADDSEEEARNKRFTKADDSAFNAYHAKKYVAGVFCGVGKTPEAAIADLYIQASKQWPTLSAAYPDISYSPLVTEFDEILPCDISSTHPWYEMHLNDGYVKSLPDDVWVRGNEAAYYRWDGHLSKEDGSPDKSEYTYNCAYIGVVRTDYPKESKAPPVYGILKYYTDASSSPSTLNVGATQCKLAGGPVVSPEGKYYLYYSTNLGTAAYSAPVTGLDIDNEIFKNGYNMTFAARESQRVDNKLPNFPQLRMRDDEYKYIHLAYDRADMPYLESVYLGVGESRKEAYSDLLGTTNAYAALDVNCNYNSFSDQWIAIGYRRTSNKSYAIRDVFLYLGSDPKDVVSINDGYYSKSTKKKGKYITEYLPYSDAGGVPYTLLKHNLTSGGSEAFSLNSGNGGKELYLYYTTSPIFSQKEAAAEVTPITNLCISCGDISPKYMTAEDAMNVYEKSYFSKAVFDVSAFGHAKWECVLGVEDDPLKWKTDASTGRRMSLNEGVLPGMGKFSAKWHSADRRVNMFVDRGVDGTEYNIRQNAELPDQGYYSASSTFGYLKQAG